MKIKDKVLIVEDEQSISNFISMILTANGFDTIIVRSGEEALTMIASHCPDMIVLDLGLPDMDGMEVLKSVRKWSNLPVVVVSARNHEHDKVEALDYGADDYLVKPFDRQELVARVKAVLARTMPKEPEDTEVYRFGALTIDVASHSVKVDGKETSLTPKEFDLLVFLAGNKGMALSREKILQKVWNYDYYGEDRTVDTHVKMLRSHLGSCRGYIVTVWGIGYKFDPDAAK